MKNSFEFGDLLEPEQVAAVIAKDRSELSSRIKNKVRKAILGVEPSTCLSFELYSGSSFQQYANLEASISYVQVLIAFMCGREYESRYRIESCVTPIAVKAAEEAILEFYSDEKIQQAVAKEIARQL